MKHLFIRLPFNFLLRINNPIFTLKKSDNLIQFLKENSNLTRDINYFIKAYFKPVKDKKIISKNIDKLSFFLESLKAHIYALSM